MALVKDRPVGTLFCILRLGLLISLPCCASSAALGQTSPERSYYSRLNTLGLFGAYSNDSSHILLGYAEQRKLLSFGVSYSRRLLFNNTVIWQYNGELLPVALESDPLTRFVNVQTSPTTATYTGSEPYPMVSCTPVANTYSYTYNGVTYSGTQTEYCSGRRWTIGEGMSPVGMQWNFLPRRKAQPFVIGHGGYMYSTQAIPTVDAGSFNFTFDFGAGIELYRTPSRSIRAEYRYHHISNHNTAVYNPGIDSGLFQLTYAFGH
jgi:opacity protein-like surface antigen